MQLSPDNRLVVFSSGKPDIDKNLIVQNLWLTERSLATPRQLTFSKKGKNFDPKWSSDSKRIFFLSDRSGVVEIWTIAVDGGEAEQLTNIGLGIDSFLLHPDNEHFLITTRVYPSATSWEENRRLQKEHEEQVVKMKVITEVPFRRWDNWTDEKRTHIFLIKLDGTLIKDLTPGNDDVPAWSESGLEDYAICSDGKEVCFVKVIGNESLDGIRNLFITSIDAGEHRQITHNLAQSFAPRYSPDGKYIAYLATSRPLLDGDNVELTIYNRSTKEEIRLTSNLDRIVTSFTWSSDSSSIWFIVEDRAEENICEIVISTKEISKRARIGHVLEFAPTTDNQHLLLLSSAFSQPAEVWQMQTKKTTIEQLTHLNDSWRDSIAWPEVSKFEYVGWREEKVESWIVTPPDFDQNKKYPLLLLIHGGPHSAWSNFFHYRWNAQLFAAAGFVVISPNFHGSSGYGQAFTDSLRGDWGGAAYEDLMKAVDQACKWSYIDSSKLTAAGASYGGYMANWIAGHTNRFNCIVSHDGIYNLITSIYTADFVGGTKQEIGGTPWDGVEVLHEASPSTYAKNFNTPMLIIHGQLDYRVDVSDGFAMFQVLKAKGVAAKFLYFPDENHWVLKPNNSIAWHNQVLDWLQQWTRD